MCVYIQSFHANNLWLFSPLVLGSVSLWYDDTLLVFALRLWDSSSGKKAQSVSVLLVWPVKGKMHISKSTVCLDHADSEYVFSIPSLKMGQESCPQKDLLTFVSFRDVLHLEWTNDRLPTDSCKYIKCWSFLEAWLQMPTQNQYGKSIQYMCSSYLIIYFFLKLLQWQRKTSLGAKVLLKSMGIYKITPSVSLADTFGDKWYK